MSEEEKEARRVEKLKQFQSEGIKFDYIKSNHFRVIHVDGIWGGLTTRLNIQMVVFNERNPIPQQATYGVNPDGAIGEEIREKRIGRDAIIREVEASLVMDLGTAKALIVWLQDKIDNLEKAINAQGKDQESE